MIESNTATPAKDFQDFVKTLPTGAPDKNGFVNLVKNLHGCLLQVLEMPEHQEKILDFVNASMVAMRVYQEAEDRGIAPRDMVRFDSVAELNAFGDFLSAARSACQ